MAARPGLALPTRGGRKYAAPAAALPLLCLLFMFMHAMSCRGMCQQPVTDRDLLLEKIKHDASAAGSKGQPDPISRNAIPLPGRDPVSVSMSILMHAYRSYISPQLPSACLYHPSCSQFAVELIHTYGMAKGIISAADRLMRCNRMGATDIHPLTVSEELNKVVESVELYRIHP